MAVNADPVSFEPLSRADFPLLAKWLAEPLVARWWNHDPSLEAIAKWFGPSIDGEEPTDVFIAKLAHRPIGLIQRYRIDAYKEYLEELAPVCSVPPAALSVDYLIGEPDARGHGLGSTMIATLVDESWRSFPQSNDVLVPVSVANRASWRALERAGFERIAAGELKPDNPRDSRDHFIYLLRRPD